MGWDQLITHLNAWAYISHPMCTHHRVVSTQMRYTSIVSQQVLGAGAENASRTMLPRGIFGGIPLRARAVRRALSQALAAVASWRRGAAGEGMGVAAAIWPGERAWAREG